MSKKRNKRNKLDRTQGQMKRQKQVIELDKNLSQNKKQFCGSNKGLQKENHLSKIEYAQKRQKSKDNDLQVVIHKGEQMRKNLQTNQKHHLSKPSFFSKSRTKSTRGKINSQIKQDNLQTFVTTRTIQCPKSQQSFNSKGHVDRLFNIKQIVGTLQFEEITFTVKRKIQTPLNSSQKQRDAQNKVITELKIKDAQNKVITELGFIDKIIRKNRKDYAILKSQNLWVIDDQFLSKDQSKDLCADMRRIMFLMTCNSSLKQIILKSHNPESLLMFSHINYENLLRITINAFIQSIQPLTWLNCPNVKSLTIQNSRITNISSLNRLNWGKLGYLRLMANPIQDMSLNRIKMKKSSQLRLVYALQPHQFRNFNQLQQKISLQDIRYLAKSQTQCSSFKRNQKFCRNRIPQIKVIQRMVIVPRINLGSDQDQSSDSSDQE